MAGSVNKVILIGNLGKDPEIRRTQDGRPIAHFNVATSDTWRDKTTGERRERTEWHRVVIFNEGLCRIAEQYLKKGSKVYLEGSLQTRKWQDQSGQDKYTTEVVLQGFNSQLTMLDRAGGGGAGAATEFGSDEGTGAFGSPGPSVRERQPAPARAATWTTRFRSNLVARLSACAKPGVFPDCAGAIRATHQARASAAAGTSGARRRCGAYSCPQTAPADGRWGRRG